MIKIPAQKPSEGLDQNLSSEITTKIVEEPEVTQDEELPKLDTSLLGVVSGGQDSIDLPSVLRNRYGQDLFFKTILENPKHYRNFEVNEGLVYLRVNSGKVLCIPKILVESWNVREIIIEEAHSVLAHLGTTKTLTYLREHVWWKTMATDTAAYCDTCHTCHRSKPSNQKPYGLLNPLSMPSHPWESIGVDFVGPLPESKNRDGTYDTITTVICLLTRMVHLIPSRQDYKAWQVAELMFEQIYKLHGVPKNIISDRDSLFTSVFWKHLHELVGTKLRMSSAYHPQSDGATERANKTLMQMLRQCVNAKQKDWVSKLPAIEFAINSA
jgi:hypothetical protein